jgi:hypothetical protein
MDSQDPLRNPPPPPPGRAPRRKKLGEMALAGLGTLFVMGIVVYIIRLALRL